MKNLIRNPKVLLSLFLLAIISVACGGSPTVQETGDLKGSIAVSGAWALYPMMTRWAEEYHNIHPAVEFDISAGGAGKGMADALVGAVDIGMVSRDIRPEEEAKGAYWIAVTKDAVFPTINAQNPVLSDLLEKGVTQERPIATPAEGIGTQASVASVLQSVLMIQEFKLTFLI